MAGAPSCSDRGLWDAWLSIYFFPALMIADRLNLFSYLARSPSTREEVRVYLGIEQRVSEALLGVLLAANPPFLTLRDRYLLLTDLSRNYLLPESPYYYGGVFQDAWVKHPTASLLWHKIRPEEIPQEPLFANTRTHTQLWESGTLTHQQAKHITQVMHSHSVASALAVTRHEHLFAGLERLLDAGGGSGCFSIALAERFPPLHCTIMDLPAVCQVAHDYIACSQAAARVDTYSADMFAGFWPSGYDAIFFGDIFHDWNQEQCLDLAQRSYASFIRRIFKLIEL